MPTIPHSEKHFNAGETVRDIVLGMADGLTVPFALAAGLSGALVGTDVIVTAGIAEIAAGATAMGLGGYLAARSDAEHYVSERRREHYEVRELEQHEIDEVVEIFQKYGLSHEDCAPIITRFKADPDAWVDFMMRFELGLEQPDPKRALRSAFTIGGAYVVGGLVPLLPYMLVQTMDDALYSSMACTAVALTLFGAIKGRFTGAGRWRGAWQTLLVGGAASSVAYGLARLLT